MRTTFLLALPLALLAACTSNTRIQDEWTADALPTEPVQRVLVVGVSQANAQRLAFEREFAQHLARVPGVEPRVTTDFVPADAPLDKDLLTDLVKRSDLDAVLVVRLLAHDQRTRVTPGGPRMGAAWGPGGFHDYYWGYTWSSDQVTVYDVVQLETSLHGLPDLNMLWTATTESFSPSSTSQLVEELSDVVIAHLQERGLLPPGP